MIRWTLCIALGGLVGLLSTVDARWCSAADLFTFRDTTQEAGLLPEVATIKGHAAGWGDVDNDGWIDLYVGAFHEEGSKPNQFFRNRQGKFQLDDQQALRISSRPTGSLFADLDNDGDLDLYVSSMPVAADHSRAKLAGHAFAGCSLFRNDGQGKFTDISENNGACPAEFGGRSVTVLDYDGDGLLDLLVGEDPLPGYNGSKTKSSRLFHNRGQLKFEDVSRSVGIPEDIPGYGVAAADVNNDTWPDFFLASSDGGNLLFLNDGHGRFRESPGSREAFAWEEATGKGNNMVCGICFGDVNRDGLLDAVLGQHLKNPWLTPAADRLLINRGIKNGVPTYENVTEQVGLTPLPLKGPHVEIQDFDNDGLMDIFVSIVKFANGHSYPVVFKNMGMAKGLPQFKESALAVNDFPNADDQAPRSTTEFFNKMVADRKIIYSAPGPTGDYDNDGRLDIFMPNWWIEAPSLLLHNETPGGNWLDVVVRPPAGVNRMGIGSRVNIYPAGKLGQAATLLGTQEIATGYGYASGQPAIPHFGLGKTEKVDVEVILPHNKGKIVKQSVSANQRLTVGPE